MGPLVVVVLGLVAIAAVRVLADRIGVAAPLLLVLMGVAVSLVPGVPTVEIDPEWILAGVLPPLLFSSAVAMPVVDLRRAFGAVSGLSVVLVALSAVVVGLLLDLLPVPPRPAPALRRRELAHRRAGPRGHDLPDD